MMHCCVMSFGLPWVAMVGEVVTLRALGWC